MNYRFKKILLVLIVVIFVGGLVTTLVAAFGADRTSPLDEGVSRLASLTNEDDPDQMALYELRGLTKKTVPNEMGQNIDCFELSVALKHMRAEGGAFGMQYDGNIFVLDSVRYKEFENDPEKVFVSRTQNKKDEVLNIYYHTFLWTASGGGGVQGQYIDGFKTDEITGERVGEVIAVYRFTLKDGVTEADIDEDAFSRFTVVNWLETEEGQNGTPELNEEIWRQEAIPDPQNPAGGYYQGYWPLEDSGEGDEFKQVDIGFEYTFKMSVLGIFGSVQSYDPKKTLEITLYRYDAENGEYEDVPFITKRITKTAGTGKTIQDFDLSDENLANATYMLVITKDTHLTYTLKNIKVNTSNVDLTKSDNPAVALMRLPCGDIDDDHAIRHRDLDLLNSSAIYNKPVSVADPHSRRADLDGDGYVKLSDRNILLSTDNYGKNPTIISLPN